MYPLHGEIDFSRDDIPLEICKELFGKGFPYLELTELGKQELYPKLLDIGNNIVQNPSNSVLNFSKKIVSKIGYEQDYKKKE